jgi:hypothetical protein
LPVEEPGGPRPPGRNDQEAFAPVQLQSPQSQHWQSTQVQGAQAQQPQAAGAGFGRVCSVFI